MSAPVLMRLGAALAGLGVALGAFGAHGLRGRVAPDLLDAYKTGVLYHLIHALALLILAAFGDRVRWSGAVGAGFVAGIVLFSGSLYMLALTGVRALGAITPLGGLAFIASWAVWAVAGLRAAG